MSPDNLIGLTPGEQDAAEAAIESMVGASKATLIVETVINAANEHRARTNALAAQHGCYR